jgi:hypothetical protein
VYPTVFVTLKTRARRTMGRKERLNLRSPMKKRRIQAAGNEYMAIQNIFESTALAGCSGC